MDLARVNRVVIQKFILITTLGFFFAGCSSTPDTVTLDGEMTFDLVPGPEAAVKFGGGAGCLGGPDICRFDFTTQAIATVQEGPDAFTLSFTEFTTTQTSGPDRGIEIALNPQKSSEGSVSKLDENGNPLDLHDLQFNLRVQLGGVIMEFDNLRLRGSGHRLGLTSSGDPQSVDPGDGGGDTLQVTSMKKDVGTELIQTSNPCDNCPCDFYSIPPSTCWVVNGVGPRFEKPSGQDDCFLEDDPVFTVLHVEPNPDGLAIFECLIDTS
ncbi:MAG: hypothetical protein R3257_01525, partial [bacterium]|nr:hypothetical protein [bacterium]